MPFQPSEDKKKPWEMGLNVVTETTEKKPWEMNLQADVKKKESSESTSTTTQPSSASDGKTSSSGTSEPKTNFEKRILNPSLKIKNQDGSVSTHKMMSFEAEGKYYAAPTIVEINGKLKELQPKEAIDYALKNGEYKEFKTDSEAKKYADGDYKIGTPLDPNYKKKKPLDINSLNLTKSKEPDFETDSFKKLKKVINNPQFTEQEQKHYQENVIKPALNKYRQNTAITPDDEAEVDADLQAKKQQEGFWNNAKAMAKTAINATSDFLLNMTDEGSTPEDLKLKIDPLFDEKKEATSKLKEQGIKPDTNNISELADKLYKDKQIEFKKSQKVKMYLNDLEDSDPVLKANLKLDADNKLKTLAPEIQDVTNRIKLNEHYFTQLDEQLKQNLPEQDRIAIEDERQNIAKQLDNDYKAYSTSKAKLGTAEEEFDAFKRNYDTMDNVSQRVATSLASTGIETVSGLSFLNSLTGTPQAVLGDMQVQEQIGKIDESLSETKEKFRPNNKELTWQNFAQTSLDMLGDTSGLLATMAIAPGTAGLTAVGVQGAGRKHTEMLSEQKSGKSYTPMQMAIAPLVSGTAEGLLFALPVGKGLQSTKRVWASALKDDAIKPVIDGEINTFTNKLIKAIGEPVVTANTQMSLNNVVQNAINKDILGKKDVGYFDNAVNVLRDGTLLTGLLHSSQLAHVVVDGVKDFGNSEMVKKLDSNGLQISELAKQLENPELDDAAKTVVKKTINKLTSESSKIINSTIKKMSRMPDENIEAVLRYKNKMNDFQEQANTIKSSDMPDATKTTILNGLKDEFKSSKEKKEELIDAEYPKMKTESITINPESISLKETKEGELENTKTFEVYNGDVKEGYLSLDDNGNHYQMTEAKIDNKNKGIGTEAYKKLIETLDKPLRSDEIKSDSANRLWTKLEKEGYAKYDAETDMFESIKPIIDENKGQPKKSTSSDANVPVGDFTKESQGKSNELPSSDNGGKTESANKEVLENKYTDKDGNEYTFEIYDGINGKVNSVNDRQRKDRLSFSVKNKEGETVSNTTFWKDPKDGKFYSNMTFVNKDYRRKGISTALYKYAKSLGFDIKPSEVQTDKGKEFSESINKENKQPVSEPKKEPIPTKTDLGTKAREAAKNVREKGILPDWLVAEAAKGTKKNGIDLTKAYARALETFADIHDATQDAKKAIKEAIKHIEEWYVENGHEFTKDIKNKFKIELNPGKKQVDNKLDDLVKSIPNGKEVKQYLSGETIEKYENESPTNNQDYLKQELNPALEHGTKIIEHAKEVYREDYVSKTLDYLDQSNLPVENKALVYISLENDLAFRKLSEPENELNISKLQDLVRSKSQAYLRSASLAINFGRLRKFAEVGYDLNRVTDNFFSSTQLEGKKKIEKAVQASADEINAEAERQENGENFEIAEPIKKRNAKVVKADIKNVLKAMRNDLLKAAKGDSALSSVPYATQLAAVAPHVVKLSRLLVELGGLKTKEIIDEIFNNIKEVAPDVNREDIRDILNTEKENKKPKEKNKAKEIRETIKQALIGKGYGREITVTKRVITEGGSVKREKTKRQILDWKKLAGEEGSIDKLRDNVESVLKDKGYSESEIESLKEDYKEEYNNLRASIIEKSLNELENRNTPRKPVDVKTSAKKLAELYNYGLFEKEADTYNNILNSSIGLAPLGQKAFLEAKELAKSLSELYQTRIEGKKVDEFAISHGVRVINKKIEELLARVAWKESNGNFKAAAATKEYVALSQRMMLNSVKQLIENPSSGITQRIFTKIGYSFSKTDTKQLSKNRSKIAKQIYEDTVRNGGLSYGDITTPLVSQSKVEDYLNGKADNKTKHTLLSWAMGRAYLEGADSMHKSALTEKYFSYNLIKVLSDKSNSNRISKKEAVNYVSKHLTGQSFEDAVKTAIEIIKETNSKAGKVVLPDNVQNANRIAEKIVKWSLVTGGKVTLKQIESSYKAAYTAAGFDLGHEANNPISKSVGKISSATEVKINKAIKEKKWNEAAAYTYESILTRNILNPFVGGGTNWVVLTLQKTGIDFVSPLTDFFKAKDNKLDLSTEEGLKSMEKSLLLSLKYKNSMTRFVTGAMASLLICSTAVATGADEDIESWLSKNEWARKYFNVIAPQVLVALLAIENGKLAKYFTQLLNIKIGEMNEGVKLTGAIKNLSSGKTEDALGTLGDLAGSRLSAPLPFRFVRDTHNIVRGIRQQDPIKTDFHTKGFWNGYFKGGLVEYIGSRPDTYGSKESSAIQNNNHTQHKSHSSRPSRTHRRSN